MDEESMIGRGREAIDMIVDPGSLQENVIGDFKIDESEASGGWS